MEKADFSKFGKVFQDKLTYLILTERTFANQIGEVLDINFLEFKYLQTIVRSIYDYKEKYEVYPSLKIMASLPIMISDTTTSWTLKNASRLDKEIQSALAGMKLI